MTPRQHVKALEAELASYRAELKALEADGNGGDLRAIFLREGIGATAYRIGIERLELDAPKRDQRFNARYAPLRKAWR